GLPFRLFCAAIAALIFYEWTRMSRAENGATLGFLPEVLILVFIGALVAGLPALWLLLLVAAITVIVAVAARLRGAAQWEASGLAYASLSGLSLAYLRGDSHSGLIAILFLFAVVWATDIAAYFVGRRVGGPKLAPSISPGKTQSGALGGAVGGIAAG
ncbi:phosphatidate cytidylyltransferase, partial [Mesorhizobium sp.]